MTSDVRKLKRNGLTEAWKIQDREYKTVPDTEGIILSGAIGVSRGGIFKELNDPEAILAQPVKWPFDYFETDKGFVRANVLAAVAVTYLSPEQRDEIRSEFPTGIHHSDPRIVPVVEKYNVNKYAISYITNTKDIDIEVLDVLHDLADSKGKLGFVNGATVAAYNTKLVEFYRPPSRGGNTKALHKHLMLIEGQWYSFFALGSKKFVFKNDTVKFEYLSTEEGYRNVKKQTIVTKDEKGKLVYRGNRGFKKQLRTTPSR